MPISPNIQRLKKTCRGFSLIELLVVCTIVSFLGTVLYATFYQGVNLWKRSQVDRGEFRDLFFAERLTQDLRSAFTFSGQKIQGRAGEFNFYTLLSGSDLGLQKETSSLLFPCAVRYYFNTSTRQVTREVQSYSQILTGAKERIRTSTVFEGPQRVEWMFMGRNKTASILWQTTWQKDYLPNAVKLSIEYEGQKQSFIRIINIPGGGLREKVV
ncbi:MAG: prepilin-type N-terminal cleavage/methylation domain-containing protein [Candidatus Omnitrophica bacterium]|nr:prepilin-type N-terminal cleavage/methylation domain-containing protein [Candidatus Omnitrophota bacterium]